MSYNVPAGFKWIGYFSNGEMFWSATGTLYRRVAGRDVYRDGRLTEIGIQNVTTQTFNTIAATASVRPA